MSDYELNRAIHHVYTDRERTIAFRKGDYRALDAFDLTPEERTRARSARFPEAVVAARASGPAVPSLGGAQSARVVSRERRAAHPRRAEQILRLLPRPRRRDVDRWRPPSIRDRPVAQRRPRIGHRGSATCTIHVWQLALLVLLRRPVVAARPAGGQKFRPDAGADDRRRRASVWPTARCRTRRSRRALYSSPATCSRR